VAGDARSNGAYALRPDVVATVLDEGALLLDLETKYFYLLNRSGWAVTQLFEEGASLDHVANLCRAWGASDADVQQVEATVDEMIRERLLEPAAMDAAPSGEAPQVWEPIRFERQAEPLQRVIVSAFDPSIPLAE
jgi:hypothetical protein